MSAKYYIYVCISLLKAQTLCARVNNKRLLINLDSEI